MMDPELHSPIQKGDKSKKKEHIANVFRNRSGAQCDGMAETLMRLSASPQLIGHYSEI
jgi:hypothetical protein